MGNDKRYRFTNYNTDNRLKIVAKLYAQMILSKSIDYNALYLASYNSNRQKCILPIVDEKQLLKRMNKILSNNRLQQMLAEELKELLEKNGFSVIDAINYRKQILLGAIAKGDFANANKALDSFDDKLGISNVSVNQPSPLPINGSINLEHLAKVKQVNYKEIKQLRDSNGEQVTTNVN